MKKNNGLKLVVDTENESKKYEPTLDHCQICQIEGEIGGCEVSSVFLHEIEPVTKINPVFRNKMNLPDDYTHYLVGGFGSFVFDFCAVFFTAMQMIKLPRLICDNCLTQLLVGETYLVNDHMAEMVLRQEGNAVNQVVLNFEKITLCDGCGRPQQETTIFSPGNELCWVRRADIESRHRNNIPIEYEKYVHAHPKKFLPVDVSQFLLLFKPGELDGFEEHICEVCLQQLFSGKELPYTEHFEQTGIYKVKVG